MPDIETNLAERVAGLARDLRIFGGVTLLAFGAVGGSLYLLNGTVSELSGNVASLSTSVGTLNSTVAELTKLHTSGTLLTKLDFDTGMANLLRQIEDVKKNR